MYSKPVPNSSPIIIFSFPITEPIQLRQMLHFFYFQMKEPARLKSPTDLTILCRISPLGCSLYMVVSLITYNSQTWRADHCPVNEFSNFLTRLRSYRIGGKAHEVPAMYRLDSRP
jgi:hypothetical protein